MNIIYSLIDSIYHKLNVRLDLDFEYWNASLGAWGDIAFYKKSMNKLVEKTLNYYKFKLYSDTIHKPNNTYNEST